MSVCSIRTHSATFQPTQGPELLPRTAGQLNMASQASPGQLGSYNRKPVTGHSTTQGNSSSLAKSCFIKIYIYIFFFPSHKHTGQSKIQTCNELGRITVKLCGVGERGLLHIYNYRSTISMYTFSLCVYGARNQAHGLNIHKAHTSLCGPQTHYPK